MLNLGALRTNARDSEVPDSNYVSGSEVILQVGNRRFITSREALLGKSRYFDILLSERWSAGSKKSDGSYFIDQNGDTFEHILEYFRNLQCPLFYDQSKGHALAKYCAVLAQARYFQIPRLEKWVEKKEFLEAVRFKTSVRQVDSPWLFDSNVPSNFQVQVTPLEVNDISYVCPRGIYHHMGDSSSCVRACRRFRNGPPEYETVKVLKYFVVQTETDYNMFKTVAYEHEALPHKTQPRNDVRLGNEPQPDSEDQATVDTPIVGFT
jgi:hypothetical protein